MNEVLELRVCFDTGDMDGAVILETYQEILSLLADKENLKQKTKSI